jgi:zinc protease
MTEPLVKTTLPNGLEVRLKEIHTAELASHWIWYRVGSRNEQPGKTGISHWVEHMQFKGTQRFPAGLLDKAISRDGGSWNAFTYMDWTAYFEKMPAEKIELALQIESDRMVNGLYDPKEVEAERTVVISELEGLQNDPTYRLDEAVQRASFSVHPYGGEVIGSETDLHNIQRDDLYQHYRTYYTPGNAVLALSGDFDAEAMLELVRRYYEPIQPGPKIKPVVLQDKPLSSEERLELSGPGETTYLQVAYRAPAANSTDFFNMVVLDSLLAGPMSLNMFGGGGISNKTSRLYRSLVETELVIGVSAGLQATIDPFLFNVYCIVNPQHSADEVLTALDHEIQRIQDHQVTHEEIARAIKQARALFAYGSEDITNQGFWLGYSEMFASYDWFENYVQLLESVTPDAVQAAAQDYLQQSRRVVGVYLPDGAKGEGA